MAHLGLPQGINQGITRGDSFISRKILSLYYDDTNSGFRVFVCVCSAGLRVSGFCWLSVRCNFQFLAICFSVTWSTLSKSPKEGPLALQVHVYSITTEVTACYFFCFLLIRSHMLCSYSPWTNHTKTSLLGGRHHQCCSGFFPP